MKTFTQIPPGTQILLGRAARRRRALERTICSVFEGWSYEEIVPPIFDYYDVFIKGMGTGLEEQIYRFIDRDGNILALRPEFTSLVAKTVVTRLNKATRPIRLYYSGEVLRFEKPRGGRQREFAQIGIDDFHPMPLEKRIEVTFFCQHRFALYHVADAVLVAAEGSTALGYITCSVDSEGVGQIGLFAIAREARGRGLGGQLVEAALGWFHQRGLLEVSVVTQGNNAGALAVYHRHGFATDKIELWHHAWPKLVR